MPRPRRLFGNVTKAPFLIDKRSGPESGGTSRTLCHIVVRLAASMTFFISHRQHTYRLNHNDTSH